MGGRVGMVVVRGEGGGGGVGCEKIGKWVGQWVGGGGYATVCGCVSVCACGWVGGGMRGGRGGRGAPWPLEHTCWRQFTVQ